MIGQSKRASDVALSGSMKLVSAPETVIAHAWRCAPKKCSRRRRSRAVSRSRRRAAAEPEVIKKGKKEEEAEGRGKGKGQEEVGCHVPGGRSGESGRGVRSDAA
jgi:hypothetical protein